MEFVRQKHDLGCSHACLAMTTGIEYDYFWALHPGPCTFHTVLNLLAATGYVGVPQVDPMVAIECRLAIVSVPSLNTYGGMHHVVFENQERGVVVHDPNKGRKGVDWYGPDSEPVSTWAEVIRIYKNPYFILE